MQNDTETAAAVELEQPISVANETADASNESDGEETVGSLDALFSSIFGQQHQPLPVAEFVATERAAVTKAIEGRKADLDKLRTYHTGIYQDEAFDAELSDIIAEAGEALAGFAGRLSARDRMALAVLDMIEAGINGTPITGDMQRRFQSLIALAYKGFLADLSE